MLTKLPIPIGGTPEVRWGDFDNIKMCNIIDYSLPDRTTFWIYQYHFTNESLRRADDAGVGFSFLLVRDQGDSDTPPARLAGRFALPLVPRLHVRGILTYAARYSKGRRTRMGTRRVSGGVKWGGVCRP